MTAAIPAPEPHYGIKHTRSPKVIFTTSSGAVRIVLDVLTTATYRWVLQRPSWASVVPPRWSYLGSAQTRSGLTAEAARLGLTDPALTTFISGLPNTPAG